MFRLKSLKKRSFLVSRRAVKRVFEQAVFVRGLSVNLSLEASAVFDPFTIGIGVLQASVPDVILDASLLLQVSDLAPNPLHEWLLTDLNTLSVDLLTVTRIDGVVAPSLSGAAGDAAYGGLGIAYSDATLNGQYTYRANASIVATVSDILTGIADVVVQNSPDLASFETITFESLAESLTTAILGTEDWASTGDGAVATVGHTVEEFVSVRQQRIVSTINNSIAELRPSANATRLLVQDLPGLRWMALPISFNNSNLLSLVGGPNVARQVVMPASMLSMMQSSLVWTESNCRHLAGQTYLCGRMMKQPDRRVPSAFIGLSEWRKLWQSDFSGSSEFIEDAYQKPTSRQ